MCTHSTYGVSDPTVAGVGTKVRENDAYAVKLSEEARLKLAGGDPDSCKALLEEAETIVSGVVGMDCTRCQRHFVFAVGYPWMKKESGESQKVMTTH